MRAMVMLICFLFCQDCQAKDDYREVTRSLYCPTCEGQVLEESQSQVALSMKQEIRKMLEEGKTPDQIRESFVLRYGENVLLRPPLRGDTLLLWLAPVLVGLLIISALVMRFSWPARNKK